MATSHTPSSSTASDATITDSRPISVALPKRSPPPGQAKSTPVWAVTAAAPEVSTPLPAKCGRHQNGRRGVCCKDLKEDDGHLVNTDILRDVVIGLSDGLTVPFALTAGLAGLGNSRVVVLGGVAELIAGAISMGCGAFLATQAERDQYLYMKTQTSARVLQSCAGEIEREVDDILGPLGIPTDLTKRVAVALHKEELEFSPLAHEGRQSDEEDARSTALRWSDDVGLTPFLLRFGRGMEPVSRGRMYSSAATIGLGYLFGGLIPLIPYFFIQPASTALIYSSILTGIVLLIFGAIKTYITGSSGKFTDYLYGSLTTLLVGGMAAGAAFGIVKMLAEKE